MIVLMLSSSSSREAGLGKYFLCMYVSSNVGGWLGWCKKDSTNVSISFLAFFHSEGSNAVVAEVSLVFAAFSARSAASKEMYQTWMVEEVESTSSGGDDVRRVLQRVDLPDPGTPQTRRRRICVVGWSCVDCLFISLANLRQTKIKKQKSVLSIPHSTSKYRYSSTTVVVVVLYIRNSKIKIR